MSKHVKLYQGLAPHIKHDPYCATDIYDIDYDMTPRRVVHIEGALGYLNHAIN